jgi:hypothetical protein
MQLWCVVRDRRLRRSAVHRALTEVGALNFKGAKREDRKGSKGGQVPVEVFFLRPLFSSIPLLWGFLISNLAIRGCTPTRQLPAPQSKLMGVPFCEIAATSVSGAPPEQRARTALLCPTGCANQRAVHVLRVRMLWNVEATQRLSRMSYIGNCAMAWWLSYFPS